MCSNTLSLFGGAPSLAPPIDSAPEPEEKHFAFGRAGALLTYLQEAMIRCFGIEACGHEVVPKTPLSYYYVPMIIVCRKTDRPNRIINMTQKKNNNFDNYIFYMIYVDFSKVSLSLLLFDIKIILIDACVSYVHVYWYEAKVSNKLLVSLFRRYL